MKLEIEVSEQDLLEFGRQAVEKEMQASLKRMRLRTSFARLSEKVRGSWTEEDHWKAVDVAKKEAWEVYRKEIGL